MTFPTIHVNFQMSISHKYIKNDISESTCIEVAVCFPLNTYLVCHSLNKLGRRRHRVYTFQGNQLMNLNVHAISQLSSRGIPCHISNSWPVHSLWAWELWVFLLPHRCLTNDADQNCSSPECCGKVYYPIKGIEIVRAFKRWCMINRH